MKKFRFFTVFCFLMLYFANVQNAFSKERTLYNYKYLRTIDGATSGEKFADIKALYIDNDNEELYVYDQANKRFVITTLEGVFLFSFHFVDANIHVGGVQGLVAHKNGNIFIANSNRIVQVKYNGKFLNVIDLSSVVKEKPFAFSAIDIKGDILYISDQSNNQVILYDVKKNEVINVFTESIKRATKMAVYDKGFFILAPSFFKVYRFNDRGGLEASFGQPSGIAGGFSQPVAISVDKKNKRVFVSDFNRVAVMIFNYDGDFIYEFGSKRLFRAPSEIKVDNNGRVYVVDAGYLRVFEIEEQKI